MLLIDSETGFATAAAKPAPSNSNLRVVMSCLCIWLCQRHGARNDFDLSISGTGQSGVAQTESRVRPELSDWNIVECQSSAFPFLTVIHKLSVGKQGEKNIPLTAIGWTSVENQYRKSWLRDSIATPGLRLEMVCWTSDKRQAKLVPDLNLVQKIRTEPVSYRQARDSSQLW